MYDECLVANMNDATDAITGVEGSTGARIIFHRPMVITMFDFLQEKIIELKSTNVNDSFTFTTVLVSLTYIIENSLNLNKS